MSHERAHIIDVVLGEMTPDEKLAALICAVVERKSLTVSAVVSMAAVATIMAGSLDERDCIELAEVWRDAADAIEHRRRQAVHVSIN